MRDVYWGGEGSVNLWVLGFVLFYFSPKKHNFSSSLVVKISVFPSLWIPHKILIGRTYNYAD